MLDKILHPARIRGAVAVIIFGAIILVFIFWGLNPGNMGGSIGAGYVARVNGELVTLAEFRDAFEMEQQRFASFLGGAQVDAQRNFIQQQALQGLVQQLVLSQAARQEGILVPDDAVLHFIVKEIPVFQKDGRFQRDRYQAFLQNRNLAAPDFEKSVRRQLVWTNLQKVFASSASVSPRERELERLARQTKMNVGFAEFEKSQILNQLRVSDAEVQAFMASAGAQEKIEGYFKSNPTEFNQEEQIKAQHILIAFDAGNAEADKKALAQIQDIRKQAEKGDFAKLASQFSQDPGSKGKGGDLGFFGRNVMDPAFEKAAFSMKEGEISEPVKTSFGYHLIKVTGKKAARAEKLEDVKSTIAQSLLREEKFQGLLKEITEDLKAQKLAEVETRLRGFGVKANETGFFDITQENIPKLNGGERVQDAVFKLSSQQRVFPEVLRTQDRYFVIQLKDLKVEAPKEANEPLFQIESRLAGEVMQSWFESKQKAAKIDYQSTNLFN